MASALHVCHRKTCRRPSCRPMAALVPKTSSSMRLVRRGDDTRESAGGTGEILTHASRPRPQWGPPAPGASFAARTVETGAASGFSPPRAASAELGQRHLGRDVLEHDLDRHADLDLPRWAVDQVRDEARALLQLDHHHRVRHLGGEARVIDLVHDGVAEDGAASRDGRPLRLAREAAAAEVARREAVRPAGAAALHDQLVAARGFPEGRHLARDLREGLRGGGGHDGSRASTRVACVESTPPFPETSATSCCGAWRRPPSPRTWMTPSETGVMPHM